MRLVAYGGSAWRFQCKIGDWPVLDEVTLREYYGVPANRASYGVGFPGGRPCLVYRERQNVQERTGYPYTVMIDPGGEADGYAAWEAFGWNAAALLASLLDVGRGEELLDPRALSATRLREIVLEATGPEAVRKHSPGGEASSVAAGDELGPWVRIVLGSALSKTPCVVTLGMLGAAERPTLSTMAGWLARLPPEARLAGGWTVGMSMDMAAYFGARLTLDDLGLGESASPAVAAGLAGRGQQAWAILRGKFDCKLFAGQEPVRWPGMLAEEIGRVQQQEAEAQRAAKEKAAREQRERAAAGSKSQPQKSVQAAKEKEAKAKPFPETPAESHFSWNPVARATDALVDRSAKKVTQMPVAEQDPWTSTTRALGAVPTTDAYADLSVDELNAQVAEYLPEARLGHGLDFLAGLASSPRRIDVRMDLKRQTCGLGLQEWEPLDRLVHLLRGQTQQELMGVPLWNGVYNEVQELLTEAMRGAWKPDGPPELAKIDCWCLLDEDTLDMVSQIVIRAKNNEERRRWEIAKTSLYASRRARGTPKPSFPRLETYRISTFTLPPPSGGGGPAATDEKAERGAAE